VSSQGQTLAILGSAGPIWDGILGETAGYPGARARGGRPRGSDSAALPPGQLPHRCITAFATWSARADAQLHANGSTAAFRYKLPGKTRVAVPGPHSCKPPVTIRSSSIRLTQGSAGAQALGQFRADMPGNPCILPARAAEIPAVAFFGGRGNGRDRIVRASAGRPAPGLIGPSSAPITRFDDATVPDALGKRLVQRVMHRRYSCKRGRGARALYWPRRREVAVPTCLTAGRAQRPGRRIGRVGQTTQRHAA